jgi:chorismate mutase
MNQQELGADVVQPGRKETMMRKVIDSATQRGLSAELVTAVFDPIVAYAEAEQLASRQVEASIPPQP